MTEKPVPSIVKTAFYTLDVMQHTRVNGDDIRSKCYEKAFEIELEEKMTHLERQLVNVVWSNFQKENPTPEIVEFIEWCIDTSDAEKVMEVQMMVNAMETEVSEKMENENSDQENMQDGDME